jgi:hypothetical protein
MGKRRLAPATPRQRLVASTVLVAFGAQLFVGPAFAQAKPARPKPKLEIVSESVVGSCAKPTPPRLTAACAGKGGCKVSIPRALWESAPGQPPCTGHYEVQYRCPPSQRAFQATAPKGATDVKLSCRAAREELANALDEALERRSRSLRAGGVAATKLPDIPGLGTVVPIQEIQKAYEADVAAGKALPGEKPPSELSASEADAYRSLLPDIYRYVAYMADTAFRVKDLNPKAYQREDVVETLNNYACRQIDHALPGFARVVKMKIAVDVEEGEEPDAPIEEDRLRKLQCDNAEFAAKNPAACKLDGQKPPAEPKEKPKPIEVEICTVTHRQLAATLTADMRKLVMVVNPGAKAALDKLEPIQPVSAAPPAGGQAVEIPETDAQLLENEYEFITRRLIGFYRWGGANRNFTRAMAQSGDQIKKLAAEGEKTGPAALKGDLGAQKATAPARNQRELLRRAVFQWTDAYEYLQMAGFIARGATFKKQPLAPRYVTQEKKVLEGFWKDCPELAAICQEPTFGPQGDEELLHLRQGGRHLQGRDEGQGARGGKEGRPLRRRERILDRREQVQGEHARKLARDPARRGGDERQAAPGRERQGRRHLQEHPALGGAHQVPRDEALRRADDQRGEEVPGRAPHHLLAALLPVALEGGLRQGPVRRARGAEGGGTAQG